MDYNIIMVYKIGFVDIGTSELDSQKLTQLVLQITEMLAMYQAELARVLQLQCNDIGRFANGQDYIKPQTVSWERAILFIRFYELLYNRMAGNGVAMCHWLRASNRHLKEVPLLLIVDEGRLEFVLEYIQTHEIDYGR
ncbi:MAG: hypothetical protein OEY89_09165 [Gammaproteobacteria bacterium]|nr:hypothetical protein [Gammaproteobacteria bacterium]